MPEVAITVGSKTYTIACGEGEQDKVAALAAMIDEKYAQLGPARAPLEATNLVFTALFMADELADLRSRIEAAKAGAEANIAAARAESEETVKAARAAEQDANSRAEAALAEIAEARGKLKTAIAEAEERSANGLESARDKFEHDQATNSGENPDVGAAIARQHDLFGSQSDVDAVAGALEALAERTEAAAFALETLGARAGSR